ncbi:uncharacterized protein LOC111550293 [Piliocolobus tephrosceles]|uniref:uncharacterized protein LOC111550293 n=1 Tax=Piliocolobus tephrosceles TaxID=591936 RepID=UPI000C2A89A6|nr:uncharacterized protein LOC111550293 [Piliocolobus tephrosceles]
MLFQNSFLQRSTPTARIWSLPVGWPGNNSFEEAAQASSTLSEAILRCAVHLLPELPSGIVIQLPMVTARLLLEKPKSRLLYEEQRHTALAWGWTPPSSPGCHSLLCCSLSPQRGRSAEEKEKSLQSLGKAGATSVALESREFTEGHEMPSSSPMPTYPNAPNSREERASP